MLQAPLTIITNKMFDYLAKYGEMAEDRTLISKALGIRKDDQRLSVIHSMTDPYPEHIEGGLIICGSRSMPYDPDPWIERLRVFVTREIERDTPILGICFGHQLIAHILGSTVERGTKGREFGLCSVTLTDSGIKDPLFKDIPTDFVVPQNHYDVVTALPTKRTATELATSERYRFQAFAIGDRIRTVEFHPEASKELLSRFTQDEKKTLMDEGVFHDETAYENALRSIDNHSFEPSGYRIIRNFVEHFVEQD
jgi:GMP synthase (glutamine-hydrolysing)